MHEADQHREADHEQQAARVVEAALVPDAGRGRRAIGAERIERAVRDVEDLHHAEDQREADGDEKQIGGVDQPVRENGECGEQGGFCFLCGNGSASSPSPCKGEGRGYRMDTFLSLKP